MNQRRLARRNKRKARRKVTAAIGRMTGELRGIAAMTAVLAGQVEPPPESKPTEEWPQRVVSIGAERSWYAVLASNNPHVRSGRISRWMHKRVGRDARRNLWRYGDATITIRRPAINPETGGPCIVKIVQRPAIVRSAGTHSPTLDPQEDLVTFIGNKDQRPKSPPRQRSKKSAVDYKSNSAADDKTLAAVREQERRVNVARLINLA